MAKFHVTASGYVGVCTASVRGCPVGGEHYDSREEAREAYEKNVSENSQNFSTMSKKSPVIESSRDTGNGVYVEGKNKAAARRRAMYEKLGYPEETIKFMINENEKIRAKAEEKAVARANVREYLDMATGGSSSKSSGSRSSSSSSSSRSSSSDFGINSSGNATASIGNGVTFDLSDGSFGFGRRGGFSLDF